MVTVISLIDLQTVFHAIDRHVLFQKLYAAGFWKHNANYFKSYPSNRSFLVNLGGSFAQSASVSIGSAPRLYFGVTPFSYMPH